MKNSIYTVFVLAFLAFANAFGQRPVIELTFTATYGGQAVTPDSINIHNLTQGSDTTLYAPNSVLVLDYVTGIGDNFETGTNRFSVSQNFPNPFDGNTSVTINVPEKDLIKISVFDLIGHEVANYADILDAGSHSFSFEAGNEKYYLLTASSGNTSQSIKMMNFGNGGHQVKLDYQGIDESTPSFKSQNEINNFEYALGDQLRFIGYSETASGIGSDVLEDAPQTSKTYEFIILEGIPCPETPNVYYEGQTYKTVQIGTQCWFKDNLNVGTMVNGTVEQTNNGAIEKYCFGNHPADCDTYGGLYQWDEMMDYSATPGVQGICPAGWHLPSDGEFCTIATFIDPTVDCNLFFYTGTDGAGKMKSTGTIEAGTGLWYDPNTGATNSSGFTTLPAGFRESDATFLMLGYNGGFFTSSEMTSATGWIWGMNQHSAELVRRDYSKQAGFNVRCVKDQETIPTVSTSGITNITQTTATSGGNVTNQGSSEVTERGVCWSIIQNPTIAESHTSDGTGTGNFVSNISGLNPGTVYFVRAFATNNAGTAYGEELTFTTTSAEFICGDVVNYEGQNYNTVLIGDQCWFKDNLNIGTMVNGTVEQTNNGIIEKYCFGNHPADCDTYGGLYQWNEMMQYSTTPGVQGICPDGWHLPTDGEFCTIVQLLDPAFDCGTTGYYGVDGGGKMKSTGTIEAGTGLWYAPNTGATNSSSFTALPGGARFTDATFDYLGQVVFFHTSSENLATTDWCWHMNNINAAIARNDYEKNFGSSVRCLKD